MHTTNSPPAPKTTKELTVGTPVLYTGTIGGIQNPTGTIKRPRKRNEMAGVYCYGVDFPSGYFMVDEALLTEQPPLDQ